MLRNAHTIAQFHPEVDVAVTVWLAILHDARRQVYDPAWDITVVACWSADRLDLGRLCITPDKSLQCREALPPDNIIEQLHLTAKRERTKQWRLQNTFLDDSSSRTDAPH